LKKFNRKVEEGEKVRETLYVPFLLRLCGLNILWIKFSPKGGEVHLPAQ
jgi:hypothetical protein